jgi:hypothetical protein
MPLVECNRTVLYSSSQATTARRVSAVLRGPATCGVLLRRSDT